MSKAYDRIKEGLNEALAFAQGQNTGAAVHQIGVPSVDVAAAIRATSGGNKASAAIPTPSPRA
jgi:putative transcriptional regulator